MGAGRCRQQCRAAQNALAPSVRPRATLTPPRPTNTPLPRRRYNGTIAFAYICFIMFMLFCFALVVFQTAVSEELGIGAPPLLGHAGARALRAHG
jgi:hypothetical protein